MAEVQAWANGKEMTVERKATCRWGLGSTGSRPRSRSAEAVEVAVRVEQEHGYYAGAALPEPIALECGPGQIALGDWSSMGALVLLLGGAWYRKTVTLTADLSGGRLTLDLGAVVSTAEVRINGKSAGIRVAAALAVRHLRSGSSRARTASRSWSTTRSRITTAPFRRGTAAR